MLRNAIVIGIFIGASASLPILYQSYPGLVEAVTASHPEETIQASATPIPASANPAGSQSGRRVAIDVDPSGHYYGDFKLNGRRVEALIDTGASAVAINLSTARKLGLNIQVSDMKGSVSTANGKARATLVTLERVQIGRISIDDVPALVLEDQALGTTLVGMSFLNRLKSFKVDGGSLLLVQ